MSIHTYIYRMGVICSVAACVGGGVGGANLGGVGGGVFDCLSGGLCGACL
jgi:hypothetical protein